MTLLLVLACAHHEASPVLDAGPPAEPGHVTVLHTNDLHGHYLPEVAEWIEGKPTIGGFVRLDAEVRAVRASRPRDGTLLLDGGDLLTGTPLTDLVEDGAKGAPMLRFLELVGYDAWAVGNHEFDKGLDNLSALTTLSPIPVLSSNVLDATGERPLLPNQERAHVFTVNGVRVGVIGATTDGLAGLMNRVDFARLQLRPVQDAVRDEVAALDPVTDLIVVLSHIGVDDDLALAKAVPGIDLIVGGHSHTPLYVAKQVGETWIVQAGSYNRQLGVVDLVVSDDHVTEFRYELRDLLPATATLLPDPEIAALATDYQARIDAHYGEVISTAPDLLDRDYHHESGLGRWITGVLRDATSADVALYNGGGLRADLPAGNVTRGSLFACFPFGNEVVTFELSGKDLASILLANASAEADEKRGFLAIAGVVYTWRLRSGAPELGDVEVAGAPLDPVRTYVIATNSYVAEQWDKHLGVQPKNVQAWGYSDFEAAVEAAKKGPVRLPLDVRAVREK